MVNLSAAPRRTYFNLSGRIQEGAQAQDYEQSTQKYEKQQNAHPYHLARRED